MDDAPTTSRRGYLHAAGMALTGGLSGLLGSGSARASETESETVGDAEPDGEARYAAADISHYYHVPLGSNMWFNRVNNWSPRIIDRGTGQYMFSQWERQSSVVEAQQSVMEGVYGETMEPRHSMGVYAHSYGGAGTVITDAWAGVEFYTSGTAAQTTILAYALYDEGENWLALRESDGRGYTANLLDLSVMDLTARTELTRAPLWRHEGYPGTIASSGQREPLVWTNTAVNASLAPDRYYGIYFLGRSIAYSTSPIEGAWHPPEAKATQKARIGHVYVYF